MRLSKIKLAGFKSFVDPTTIYLPSNLIGIVGPNGCGKSNIIDAVRWVMGESSAKYLRGDAMADVIFSGSSARRPVGHATIELVFDNADGQVGGQYASYAEIAVKRTVSRDGTSQYFLNGGRCRRRDITDIFLGTGLGPRSYAIIEQGTISRLIEAKPDELRVFLEEAAGISKYKERRRETENRIRHTKENIDRLNDLQDQVTKQLKHLQRQARAAERYQELKVEERNLKAGVLALHWRGLDAEVSDQDRAISARETALEGTIAEQRRVENALLKCREHHESASETFNAVQARYYQKGADVARHEQALKHARELRRRQQSDVEDTERALSEVRVHVARDEDYLEELVSNLYELEPKCEAAATAENRSAAALTEAEDSMYQWQQGWDEFMQQVNKAGGKADIERTRIGHLERQLRQALERAERARQERAGLAAEALENEIRQLDAQVTRCLDSRVRGQEELDALRGRLGVAREEDQALGDKLHGLRSRFENSRGRLASLRELQQAALGKSRRSVIGWLEARGWAENPRLVERMQVEPGWERAVETVLGFKLEAVCVHELDENAQALEMLEDGEATLVQTSETPSSSTNGAKDGTRLSAKVEGPIVLQSWLESVHAAEDFVRAKELHKQLQPHESVITRSGVWLGQEWARVIRENDGRAGVLAREQEIKELQHEIQVVDAEIDGEVRRQATLKSEVKTLEAQRETLQAEVNRAHREHADSEARLDARRNRLEQMEQRITALDAESGELDAEVDAVDGALKQARSQLETALEQMHTLQGKRGELEETREQRRLALERFRAAARGDREHVHALGLKRAERRSARESTERALERMRAQLTQLETRKTDLEDNLTASLSPLEKEQVALNEAVQLHSSAEAELGEARRALESIDAQFREFDQDRLLRERAVEAARSELEGLRLKSQESRVRRKTLVEQLAEMNCEASALLADLEEQASAELWEERLETLGRRIERLGAINLAAIEEFAEQSERKQYLDGQLVDLSEALTTLETAIRKIDRETRARFKETFEQVNAGIKASFPRLFGGGHAYLELTGEELLDAGVAIMARPPGKRNSTIHLLSGGEKALTAVALVFAIFDLNPAPFCLLDEVDAPLDEANVGRFCELVQDMSKRIQFLFITHNKATMEMAKQLTGVTMNEPGVSRLVTVDVEEAARMAVG